MEIITAGGMILVIAIALLYAIQDIYRNKEINKKFIIWAFTIALFWALVFNLKTYGLWSIIICLLILGIGYYLYATRTKSGEPVLGPADTTLLATISLLIPFQTSPLLVSVSQNGWPFIITILIDMILPLCIYGAWLAYKREKHMALTVPIFFGLAIALLYGNLIFML